MMSATICGLWSMVAIMCKIAENLENQMCSFVYLRQVHFLLAVLACLVYLLNETKTIWKWKTKPILISSKKTSN